MNLDLLDFHIEVPMRHGHVNHIATITDKRGSASLVLLAEGRFAIGTTEVATMSPLPFMANCLRISEPSYDMSFRPMRSEWSPWVLPTGY